MFQAILTSHARIYSFNSTYLMGTCYVLRNCSRCWKHSTEQNRQNPFIFLGAMEKANQSRRTGNGYRLPTTGDAWGAAVFSKLIKKGLTDNMAFEQGSKGSEKRSPCKSQGEENSRIYLGYISGRTKKPV